MKKYKYIHSTTTVVKWCPTLKKYVNEIFCRWSYDAKMIAKLLNDIQKLEKDADPEYRTVVTATRVKIKKRSRGKK